MQCDLSDAEQLRFLLIQFIPGGIARSHDLKQCSGVAPSVCVWTAKL